MSKKLSILLVGGFLITLMLSMGFDVMYAAGTPTPRATTPAPTPTRTPTLTATKAPTVTSDKKHQLYCTDADGNAGYGIGEPDADGDICNGYNMYFNPKTGRTSEKVAPKKPAVPIDLRVEENILPYIGLLVIGLTSLFVMSRFEQKKPPSGKEERPESPTLKVKVKLQLLSNTQVLGLLLAVGIFWGSITSLNAMFNGAKEAGLAWEKALVATGQTVALAQPSLARDGLLVVLWIVFLEPTIKLVPFLGEGFGLMFTLIGTGMSIVLGRFYGAIWKGIKWVFKNVLKPFGKGILWFFKLISIMLIWGPKKVEK